MAMSLQRVPGCALLAHKALSIGRVQSTGCLRNCSLQRKVNARFIHDFMLAARGSGTLLKPMLRSQRNALEVTR